MIDYFSLALGHGLLAIALLRLVMREELDVDPHIQSFVDALRARRDASSVAGRNANRRGQSRGEDGPVDDPHGEDGIG
jgi:hypothetical protein